MRVPIIKFFGTSQGTDSVFEIIKAMRVFANNAIDRRMRVMTAIPVRHIVVKNVRVMRLSCGGAAG
jgi:hypothetical protein